MISRMDASSFDRSDPNRLADILGLDESAAGSWSQEDMSQIWQHQLGASIESEIRELGAESVAAMRLWLDHQPQPRLTFEDLLLGPGPSVTPLTTIKQFVRKLLRNRYRDQPREIHEMLYVTSIAAAWVFHRVRITQLDTEHFLRNLRWAIDKEWIDERTRSVLEGCIEALENEGFRSSL